MAVTLGPLDLVVVDSLETALHTHFGWSRFRAGQRPVVEAVLAGGMRWLCCPPEVENPFVISCLLSSGKAWWW